MCGKRIVILLLALMMNITGCSNDDIHKEAETCDESIEDTIVMTTESIEKEPHDAMTDLTYDWTKVELKNGVRSYEDNNCYSKFLIDVSDHQGEIDWFTIAKKGIVEECIIRLGSGVPSAETYQFYLDKEFVNNYSKATDVGIPVYGVYYHSVAISKLEAEQEAKDVLGTLQSINISKDVLIFIDVEAYDGYDKNGNYIKHRNADVTDSELREYTYIFADIIEKEGYTVGVYVGNSFGKRTISLSMFEGYPIWYAHWTDNPNFNQGFEIWQYTNTGDKISGIDESNKGNLDFNMRFVRK